VMSDDDADEFIWSTFRSVWSLELLVYLSDHAETSWSRADLVESLRASDLIISQSLEGLLAAGLVSVDADGRARYAPASPQLRELVEQARDRYRRSPNRVRRSIISSASGGLTAFADAFKFRK